MLPKIELFQLLDFMKVSHNDSLESIVENTQKWLRPEFLERWQLGDISDKERVKALFSIAQKLGFISEIKPHHHHYDYALILGASLDQSLTRFRYLNRLWQEGIRFDRLVLLGGARPLDREKERPMELIKSYKEHMISHVPTNETELLLLLLTQELDKEIQNRPVEVIHVPMLPKNGKFVRPTTSDTIEFWLNKKPENGSCLFISSQPYCYYQESVIQYYLNNIFSFDVVGSELKEELFNAKIFLDTVARVLYQLKQNQRKIPGLTLFN